MKIGLENITPINQDNTPAQKLSDIMRGWDARFDEFDHVYTLYRINRSGRASQEQLEVISQEGLTDVFLNIVEYVKKFFKWLYEKITAFLKWIWAKVKAVYRAIRNFLVGDRQSKGMKAAHSETLDALSDSAANVPCYYYIFDINKTLVEINDDYFPMFRGTFHTDDLQGLKDLYNEQYGRLERNTKRREEPDYISAGKLSKVIDDNYSWVEFFPNKFTNITNVIEEINKNIAEFNKISLNEANVVDQTNHILDKTSRLITSNIVYGTVKWDYHVPYGQDPKQANANQLKVLNTMLQSAMYVDAWGGKVYDHMTRHMMRLFKDYNVGREAVNIRLKVPAFLKTHLEAHYGKKFKADYIFISSFVGSTMWDAIIGKHGRGHVGGSTDMADKIYSTNVWISSDLFVKDDGTIRKDFNRDGDKHYDDKRTAFISLLVHEFRHCFDAQHDSRDAQGSNSSTKHDDRWEERLAIHSEQTFNPTQQELSWAAEVIQQMEKASRG